MSETLETISEQIRAALQREFIVRCQKNPAYSLRAFAKYLEIDQSHLSKILKGQRPVTKALVQLFSPKLARRRTKVAEIHTQGTVVTPDLLSLAEDEFEMISSWQHFAILELVKTVDFNPAPARIAARLGIHVEQVRDALARLSRLGFIRQEKKGMRLLTPNTTSTNLGRTSLARKRFQRTLLEKSAEAIEEVPFEHREHGSLTVAINKKRMPEFKERLKNFRKELADFLQPQGKADLDEVYQVTVSLFPLTKINQKKGEIL